MLKAKQANADALFVYSNEEESARALRELRKQGYDKPIVGETVLTSQKVIELAGDAANGAIAHVGLTADAPQPGIKAFDDEVPEGIQATRPTTTRSKGYTGMYIVKVRHREASASSIPRRSPRRCTAPSSPSRTTRAS